MHVYIKINLFKGTLTFWMYGSYKQTIYFKDFFAVFLKSHINF